MFTALPKNIPLDSINQNAAARMITKTKKTKSTTLELKSPPCQPVPYRIDCKELLFVYKSFIHFGSKQTLHVPEECKVTSALESLRSSQLAGCGFRTTDGEAAYIYILLL